MILENKSMMRESINDFFLSLKIWNFIKVNLWIEISEYYFKWNIIINIGLNFSSNNHLLKS